MALLVRDKSAFQNLLKMIYSKLGTFEKVLFGTDSPIFNGICAVHEMVEYIGRLDIPETQRANLLGNTAKRLLHLN